MVPLTEADKHELHVGDMIVINGEILSLGNKSFNHRHEMRNRTTGDLVAQMESVTVAFGLQARVAVPLFDYFRKAAERILADTN